MSDTPIHDRLWTETYDPDYRPARPSVTERDWWWRAEAALIGAAIVVSLLFLLAAGGYFS